MIKEASIVAAAAAALQKCEEKEQGKKQDCVHGKQLA